MEDSRETSPSSNNSSEELSSALQLSKGMSIFLDVSIDEVVRWEPKASPLRDRRGPGAVAGPKLSPTCCSPRGPWANKCHSTCKELSQTYNFDYKH